MKSCLFYVKRAAWVWVLLCCSYFSGVFLCRSRSFCQHILPLSERENATVILLPAV